MSEPRKLVGVGELLHYCSTIFGFIDFVGIGDSEMPSVHPSSEIVDFPGVEKYTISFTNGWMYASIFYCDLCCWGITLDYFSTS